MMLESILNLRLSNILLEKFYLDGKYISLIWVYLLFDENSWIGIDCSEETVRIKCDNPQQENDSFVEGDTQFQYPLVPIPNKIREIFMNKRFISYYYLKDSSSIPRGIVLNFEENNNLVIYNKGYDIDDNLRIKVNYDYKKLGYKLSEIL